jgi:flagellar biogenesis protein FliO
VTRVLAVVAAAVLAVAADAPPADLAYAPPPAPPPPDPAGLVTRLVGVTAASLALCGGVLWLAKRARGGAAPADPGGLLRHAGRLALGPRTAVHLVEADGHTVAVAVDATGVRSITVLSEPFDPVPADPITG